MYKKVYMLSANLGLIEVDVRQNYKLDFLVCYFFVLKHVLSNSDK